MPCVSCVQGGYSETCGTKELPEITRKSRNQDADRRQLYEDLKHFADERLRRGQTMDEIRAIMDPDGDIEPVQQEAQELVNQQGTSFNCSTHFRLSGF